MSLQNEAITVTALNQYIGALMERDDILSGIAVRGEISNWKRHPSGHIYFSLKDAGGVVRCVMFRSNAARLRFEPNDGSKVVVSGSVGVYSPSGQYQIYAQTLIEDGIGDLYLAFEKLKNTLEAEGLFDPSRKKPIPRYPRIIGIVTSPSGAAVQDMFQILERRYPLAQIRLYPALVQGFDAPKSLVEGIRYFRRNPPDLIIIGRGGGSYEDLFCFNDEGLAREIAACEVPVISAVGHETDFTICDFVSDLRAPTPSAAAELAVPDQKELAGKLRDLSGRIRVLLRRRAELSRARLAKYAEATVMREPERILRPFAMALTDAETRMLTAMKRIPEEKRKYLALLAEKAHSLSPLAVLSRGYGYISTTDGHRVSSVESVKSGDEIAVRLSDGKLFATVRQTEKEISDGKRNL